MHTRNFFTIFFFLLALAMIVGGAMSGQDLTPDTPPAPETVSSFDQTIPISNTFSGGVPGGCGSTFTVRSGDTLSAIARLCGVSLSSLIAANPAITNPHLIRPGQVVAVPFAGSGVPAAAPAAIPDSSGSGAADLQQAAPQPTAKPVGLVPGGSVHVTLQSMPPDTPVTVAIGKAGNIPYNVDSGQTDGQGRFSVTVAIPQRAKPGEDWQVTIITDTRPEREYSSPPFTIQ